MCQIWRSIYFLFMWILHVTGIISGQECTCFVYLLPLCTFIKDELLLQLTCQLFSGLVILLQASTCLPIFMPIPHVPDYCVLKIGLEIRKFMLSTWFFLNFSGFFMSFALWYAFQNQSNSTKKHAHVFIGIAFDLEGILDILTTANSSHLEYSIDSHLLRSSLISTSRNTVVFTVHVVHIFCQICPYFMFLLLIYW